MNLTPTTPVDDDNTEPGPFIELSRESWAALSDSTEIDIDEATLDHIRGLGDPTSHRDVVEVYRPLTQLIHLYCMHTGALFDASNNFLQLTRHGMKRTPLSSGSLGRWPLASRPWLVCYGSSWDVPRAVRSWTS